MSAGELEGNSLCLGWEDGRKRKCGVNDKGPCGTSGRRACPRSRLIFRAFCSVELASKVKLTHMVGLIGKIVF